MITTSLHAQGMEYYQRRVNQDGYFIQRGEIPIPWGYVVRGGILNQCRSSAFLSTSQEPLYCLITVHVFRGDALCHGHGPCPGSGSLRASWPFGEGSEY